MNIGFVTGLSAEAALLNGRLAEAGGGTPAGARAAAERVVARGAEALVSFGLAGGLRPGLAPGAVLVPSGIVCGPACDAKLMQWLGGGTGEPILAGETIAATAAEKSALYRRYGAPAIDLESGAVAHVATQHGLPFAVLRAVADPAERNLAPAALIPLKPNGGIDLPAILRSVLRHPGQIPGLIALARDAARARAALVARLGRVTMPARLIAPEDRR